jgi:Tfp pilus assembly protein PilV
MTKYRRQQQVRRRRGGLSLVEVMVSTMLVGVLLVGAMKCVSGVIRSHMITGDSGRGPQLAQQLMTEILNTPYQDEGPSPVFGRESGESGGDRLDFDDVDDYDFWSAAPPEDRNGNAIFNTEGWQREVTVEFVDPANPDNVSGTDQGLKRITVSIQHNGKVVTTTLALRSDEYTVP